MLFKSCLKSNLQQLSHRMSVENIASLAIIIDDRYIAKNYHFNSFFRKPAKSFEFSTYTHQNSSYYIKFAKYVNT